MVSYNQLGTSGNLRRSDVEATVQHFGWKIVWTVLLFVPWIGLVFYLTLYDPPEPHADGGLDPPSISGSG